MAIIGVLTLNIHVEQSHSLKEKRHVVKSLKDRLRERFNVAVAEIDGLDSWQHAVIAAVTISNDTTPPPHPPPPPPAGNPTLRSTGGRVSWTRAGTPLAGLVPCNTPEQAAERRPRPGSARPAQARDSRKLRSTG